MGDLRTRRDLPKFMGTPPGGRWAKGASASTKAPILHRVQAKEGSLLWVTLLVAITVDFKKKSHKNCELNFIWGNVSSEAQETASQVTQRNCSKQVGEKDHIYVVCQRGST